MLDWGLAFGDETLTIRIVSLQNLETLGRKYQVGYLDENMAFFRFFDRGHFGGTFWSSRVKIYPIQVSYTMLRITFLLLVRTKM